ncbi:hypothetical protein KAJ27_04590 [bacterium]|nr:hypothetical protein [bacterium]
MYTILSSSYSDTDEKIASFSELKFNSLIKSLKKDLRSIYKKDSLKLKTKNNTLEFLIARLGKDKLPEKKKIIYCWQDPYSIIRESLKTSSSPAEKKIFDFEKFIKDKGGQVKFSIILKSTSILECNLEVQNKKKKVIVSLKQQIAISDI